MPARRAFVLIVMQAPRVKGYVERLQLIRRHSTGCSRLRGGAFFLEISGDRRLAAVLRPAERRALVDGVPDVEPRPAIDEQLHDVEVTGGHRLMEGQRMRMRAGRVEL